MLFRSTVEEVEDIEAGGLPLDPFVRRDSTAGKPTGEGQTLFERIHEKRKAEGLGEKPWAPFTGQEEWGLVRWLMGSGLSHKEIDKFLKLELVSTSVRVWSYKAHRRSDGRRHVNDRSSHSKTNKTSSRRSTLFPNPMPSGSASSSSRKATRLMRKATSASNISNYGGATPSPASKS